MNKNFLHQNVPTHFAFSVMLILSFLLALYTVTTAQKVVEEAKESVAFDAEKRMDRNEKDEKKSVLEKNPEKKEVKSGE